MASGKAASRHRRAANERSRVQSTPPATDAVANANAPCGRSIRTRAATTKMIAAAIIIRVGSVLVRHASAIVPSLIRSALSGTRIARRQHNIQIPCLDTAAGDGDSRVHTLTSPARAFQPAAWAKIEHRCVAAPSSSALKMVLTAPAKGNVLEDQQVPRGRESEATRSRYPRNRRTSGPTI